MLNQNRPVVGVGVDLCDISRIERAIKKEHFVSRIYSEAEWAYIQKKGVSRAQSAAAIYAAKEAAVIALGTRIAKGVFEVYDERVNDSMPEEQLYIPYENIVYIGDSATDIPCMQLVKNRGGFSVGVYHPDSGEESRVRRLYQDGRLNFFAPADYTEGSLLSVRLQELIDTIAARRRDDC